MQVLFWDLRAADCLSNNEVLHLRRYTTGFLYLGHKNMMIFSQEFHGLYQQVVKSSELRIIRLDKLLSINSFCQDSSENYMQSTGDGIRSH